MKTVDIIIPTYKPDKRFIKLIQIVGQQTYPVNKVIVINTEEQFYNQLIYGTNFLEKNRNVEVYHISKREFDHGKSRNRGVKYSKADYFVCMTQDAIPKDNYVIEELVKAVEQEKVAAAYAKQLPNENCDDIEKFTRSFNYPEASAVKSKEDIAKKGIKTYFLSNVCAIYKREIFNLLGGFTSHTIFNEDMIYAATAIDADYKIAYAAEAKVIHSHNYTNRQQFERNFDLGVSQACFPKIFKKVPSESEGIKMVKDTCEYLCEQGKKKQIPQLLLRSASKFVGFRMGKNYKKLPQWMIMKCTMSKDYWRRDNLKSASTHIDAARGYGKAESENKK